MRVGIWNTTSCGASHRIAGKRPVKDGVDCVPPVNGISATIMSTKVRSPAKQAFVFISHGNEMEENVKKVVEMANIVSERYGNKDVPFDIWVSTPEYSLKGHACHAESERGI